MEMVQWLIGSYDLGLHSLQALELLPFLREPLVMMLDMVGVAGTMYMAP